MSANAVFTPGNTLTPTACEFLQSVDASAVPTANSFGSMSPPLTRASSLANDSRPFFGLFKAEHDSRGWVSGPAKDDRFRGEVEQEPRVVAGGPSQVLDCE